MGRTERATRLRRAAAAARRGVDVVHGVQQPVDLVGGVVSQQSDAQHAARRLGAQALGQAERVEIAVPGENAAVAQLFRDRVIPFFEQKENFFNGGDKPVLSEVEGLIPAYNVFLLIEKWNQASDRPRSRRRWASASRNGWDRLCRNVSRDRPYRACSFPNGCRRRGSPRRLFPAHTRGKRWLHGRAASLRFRRRALSYARWPG